MSLWLSGFLLLVIAVTATRLWLSRRQCAHVTARRDAVPEAFRERISSQAHRKAADYTVARQKVSQVEPVANAAVALIWTAGGALAGLDALWRGYLDDPLLLGLAVILSFAVIGQLIELPFSAWRTFVVEERFGFNRTGPALFIRDAIKQLALALVLVAPLAAGSLWLMINVENWWLWVGLLWIAFMLVMMLVGPRFIAPLFNRFRPLQDDALQERIEKLLKRCGFKVSGVFVMDASRRSAHGNAYFTGLGRAKRIVFFDTLLDTLAPDEIEAVLAHELGHYRLHHVPKRLFVSSLAALAALALLDWLASQPAFYAGLGVPHPSAHMALLLFVVTAPYATYFLTPAFAWLSRRDEYQADDYAARHAEPRALSCALIKLTEDNAQTLTPDPLVSAFYGSHPPVPARVRKLERKPADA